MVSTSWNTVSNLKQSLVELHRSHEDLQRSVVPSRQVQQRQLQTDGEECDSTSVAKADRRSRLSAATAKLQKLRSAYAARLARFKEASNMLSKEHKNTSGNCERLQALIAEMYAHAEALSCQLASERKRSGVLAKEFAALEEAAGNKVGRGSLAERRRTAAPATRVN